MISALLQMQNIVLWGLIATAAMTTILHGAQGLGLSRMSLPFLLGTFFTGDHSRAMTIGFASYTIGGWLFATFYYLVFLSLGLSSWWIGVLLGLLHGLFLLCVVLPLLPFIHPRMASERDGPTTMRRLEPPGFLGLNYGRRTAQVTLLGQSVYGAIIGQFCVVH